jgi:hypothetical protein
LTCLCTEASCQLLDFDDLFLLIDDLFLLLEFLVVVLVEDILCERVTPKKRGISDILCVEITHLLGVLSNDV